jgi:3-methylcrotonyl-CoA carboxylase alpha subunit
VSGRVIRRLLIANRGEIVCRIARTARAMGVTSIAVYSDADRGARHVRECDEAHHLGGSAAAESYLDIAKLIALAARVGADAIHPGYGFLSENADFAAACGAAGLCYVGPPAAAIRAMGSKSASKTAMSAVGVPVAPGYHGEDQSAQRLAAEALRIGFPLIIKASAGGGGKGMQVVENGADVPAAIDSARRLARAAFGDDRLLLERYFAQARHVEVQVFADAHGGIVSMFDRDCSVQRRHQKIIEEAPAPGLRPEVRAAMSQAALLAARTVGYVGAGTVEFLLDAVQSFYFMEMNTRLQVEHPVTELICGIDLVEWQLRIARGETLPLRQEQIEARGCAVEARLYAEDPAQSYLPSVGRITHLRWPAHQDNLRIDGGVDGGDEISSFYDPMLGKIIARGESRAAAIDSLHAAMSEIAIIGVNTNRVLLSAILADAQFRAGAVATNFLEARRAHLLFGEPAAAAVDLQLAALWCATLRTDAAALWEDTTGWRAGAPAVTRWMFDAGEVRVTAHGDGRFSLLGATRETPSGAAPADQLPAGEAPAGEGRGGEAPVAGVPATLISRGVEDLRVEIAGQMQYARLIEQAGCVHVFHGGRHAVLRLRRTDDALQVEAGGEQGSLLTPLPGTVVAVHVGSGQSVPRGAPLVTVEAMKMEHTLTAPRDGVVSRIAFGVGERVSAGAVLVELLETEAGA